MSEMTLEPDRDKSTVEEDIFVPAEQEVVPMPTANPVAELPLSLPLERVPWAVQIATVLTILIPLLGLVAIPFLIWGWGFHLVDGILLACGYFLTAIGITIGYHRLFTHRSFETFPAIKAIFAILGSMAVQGPLFKWVAIHRRHHQFSDMPQDPHSPHHYGSSWWGVLRGFWHAHIGWFFDPDPPQWQDYVKDLRRSTTLCVIHHTFFLWVILGLAIPAIISGWVQGSWSGVLNGLIWGGLARIFLVHHITWSVNSACHLWGARPYWSKDQSRDNPLFGVLALGEGWHATHHAFPTSARHGLLWWQLDISYYLIRLLAWLRLAWNVRLPSVEHIQRARRDETSASLRATPPDIPKTVSDAGI